MKSHHIEMLCFASALALGVGAQPAFAGATSQAATDSQVSAQGTAPAAAEPATDDSADRAIVVTGIRASLRDALQTKRAAMGVVETISSKDIGVLPDTTIADELARLPGVTATRDRGNDSQAQVRGLGPRMVLGLVNGREVASSEPDRNVRWEMFPSEDIAGATVYKSQSADLIAGGVAATIDIRTLRPLDYKGPKLTVRAGALYNDGATKIPGYSGLGTRESGQYVTHLTDNLGFAIGGSYQQQKNGYIGFEGWGYDQGANTTASGKTVNTPWGAQTEANGIKETRWSINSSLQWKPDSNWDINADFLYSDVKINENQSQQWYGRNGVPGSLSNYSNYQLAGNDVTGGTMNYSSLTNVIAQYTEDKFILATGLNAKYSDDDWTVKMDGAYSQARRTDTWKAIAAESYPATTSFAMGAGSGPSVSVSGGDPAATNAQTVYSYFPGEETGPERLNDQLGSAQVDIERKFHSGFFTGVEAGLRYSHRVKSYTVDLVTASTSGDVTLPASMLTSANVSGNGINVPNMLFGNFDQLANAAGLTFTDTGADPTQYWRVKEDDFEGYVKADFAGNAGKIPFNGNFGVRLVSVSTSSYANSQTTTTTTTTDPDTGDTVTTTDKGKIDPLYDQSRYFRALPSLNFNFDLTDTLKLRAGAARVMSRPPLDELRASRNLSLVTGTSTGTTSGNSGLNTASAGNPYLKPFMAWQGDLSFEWYFHKDALFAVAGYYKAVDTNIGYTTTSEVIDGATYTVTGPQNGPGGHVLGSEITLQTPFFFLGMNHLGIYSNVALVSSNLKELAPTNNPFPAVGLADFTGEFDLWYSNHGIDARVAVKHHSPYTVIYGWNAANINRLEAETTVGASISYAVNDHITLRAQGNNLTNQVQRMYYNNDPQQLYRYDVFGRNFLFDVTFKY